MSAAPLKSIASGIAFFSTSRHNQSDSDFARSSHLTAPTFASAVSFPPRPVTGDIAFDSTTGKVWWYTGVGLGWQTFSAGTGIAVQYSIRKTFTQNIPSGVHTVLTGWDASALPFVALPDADWDLTTGVYTASVNTTISVNISLAWSPGSNYGIRTLRIVHNGVMVKSTSTQADPNAAIETTQEVSMTLNLVAGNTFYVDVYHDAPTPLDISNNDKTTISGVRVNV